MGPIVPRPMQRVNQRVRACCVRGRLPAASAQASVQKRAHFQAARELDSEQAMSSDTSNEAAAARLRVALELFETGVEMKRQQLRRDHPDLTGDEIEARVAAWLRERPGAEFGDAIGRRVTWPRDSG
jgi:Rv0078B-related antitoxin